MSSDTLLSRHQLNRITLERQLLLRRSELTAVEAVRHLFGMQAQVPNAPYVGLWSRLNSFQHDELVQPLLQKKIARIALMRSTVYLVTAEDAVGLRPLVQPALDRDLFKNSTYGKDARALPVEEAMTYGRKLLDEKPLTTQELGALLHQRWPDLSTEALAYAMRNLLPLVQLPPRGIWGVGGKTRYAVTDTWFGKRVRSSLTIEDMVLRYLNAFGPATVQDMQTWSGLTKLASVVEQLKPRMQTYRDEHGRTLYDLAEATLPPFDAPAPPRFLPAFDNLIFAFADRSRIMRDDHRKRLIRRNVVVMPVLLDGFVCGSWRMEQKRRNATLVISTLEPLSPAGQAALAEEGEGLLRFAAADAHHDIRFKAAP